MREAEWTDVVLDLAPAIAALTDRQRQVLALTVEGYTQREIAARLGIAQRVVCEYLAAARATLAKPA